MTTGSSKVRPYGWLREKKYQDPSAFDISRAARRARTTLADRYPKQSMRQPAGRVMVVALLASLACAIWQAFWHHGTAHLALLCGYLLALSGLTRLLACCFATRPTAPLEGAHQLDIVPEWTLLIALYKEADSVDGLLKALAQLEWNEAKLDLIFACERDDHETLSALNALRRIYRFRIVRVPNGGPKTKPNALQTALPFARGRYLTVYDAEDRPDPSQLRAAFQAFSSGPANLAVVQAPLVTWNHRESWIAGQFALDYAIWFRVMLPFLARLSGVLPLGGTSNHFRTDILRRVGGWDPYNVTEDADLGVRLGRLGYQASVIAPPTLEAKGALDPRSYSNL
jgi:glycosyltransferase XagB